VLPPQVSAAINGHGFDKFVPKRILAKQRPMIIQIIRPSQIIVGFIPTGYILGAPFSFDLMRYRKGIVIELSGIAALFA
jgi:hypothetical protein